MTLGYEDWRHTTELVCETDSPDLGRLHVRSTETNRLLCGEDHHVMFVVGLPVHRSTLPAALHGGCLLRVPS